jgi:glyoxylase-like metal-dependent hydrolase (beta-lactamase superfamily II)
MRVHFDSSSFGEVIINGRSYGSAEKLKSSLKKIFRLPALTTVYPGHGEKFVVRERKKLPPFLD